MVHDLKTGAPVPLSLPFHVKIEAILTLLNTLSFRHAQGPSGHHSPMEGGQLMVHDLEMNA